MLRRFGTFGWQLITFLLFFLVSAVAIFLAYGYRVDIMEQDIRKVSLIDIPTKYAGAKIYLNGSLVASELPTLLNDVLPGLNVIRVEKEGFWPWVRKYFVSEDRVTIVNDLVLFPRAIQDFTKRVLTLRSEQEYVKVKSLNLGDFLFVYKPGDSLLQLFSFGKNELQQKYFEFPQQKIQRVVKHNDENIVVVFEDKSEKLIDLKNYNVIDAGMKMRLDFNLLNLSDDNVLTLKGKSISLMLFRKQGTEEHSLFLINKNNEVKLLSNHILGLPTLDALDRILFLETDGKLQFYDTVLEKPKLIRTFDPGYQLVGWYDNKLTYLVWTKEGILITSLLDPEIYPLVSSGDYELLFQSNEQFYFLQKKELYRVNWELK